MRAALRCSIINGLRRCQRHLLEVDGTNTEWTLRDGVDWQKKAVDTDYKDYNAAFSAAITVIFTSATNIAAQYLKKFFFVCLLRLFPFLAVSYIICLKLFETTLGKKEPLMADILH